MRGPVNRKAWDGTQRLFSAEIHRFWDVISQLFEKDRTGWNEANKNSKGKKEPFVHAVLLLVQVS